MAVWGLWNKLKGTSKNPHIVIPAEAGIQKINNLDTGFRRCDGILEVPTKKAINRVRQRTRLGLKEARDYDAERL